MRGADTCTQREEAQVLIAKPQTPGRDTDILRVPFGLAIARLEPGDGEHAVSFQCRARRQCVNQENGRRGCGRKTQLGRAGAIQVSARCNAPLAP